MKLSMRQQRILELLLSHRDEITAATIAQEIGISTRTVHRLLIDLEPMLAASGITLHKKTGIGIKLKADDDRLENFKQWLGRSTSVVYSVEERKILILCLLLDSDEPIKLFSLARELHVAIPTISNDLDEIEAIIADLPLTIVRRRGYGIEIIGSETAKRECISRIAFHYLEKSDLLGLESSRARAQPLTKKLLSMVGKEQFFKLEQTIWNIHLQWPFNLSEEDYTRLLIKLSVALTRIRRQAAIHQVSFKEMNNAKKINRNSPLGSLLTQLELQLPAGEVDYIEDLLTGKHSDASDLISHLNDMSIIETVNFLIRFMEEHLRLSFHSDHSLVDGLIRHLHPAFQKIKDGTGIRNPILTQIKKDYEQLFILVRQGMDKCIFSFQVPDEEIGYIVMHFGASLERIKQFPRKIKAVLVCSSGIGSSKLLAARMAKEMPQIELIGHFSWYEAMRLSSEQYDLIISTVDLPLDLDRYIKLSPLLSNEEISRLRTYIQNIVLKNNPTDVAYEASNHVSLDRLRQLHQYSQHILLLLNEFNLYLLRPDSLEPDFEAHIRHMVSLIMSSNLILSKNKVAEQLMARERLGSLTIPGTNTALIHTRSEWVKQPFISLFRYNKPFMRNGNGTEAIKQILLMLGPTQLTKPSLEMLSQISALLLLPDMISLLETGSSDAIKSYISDQLENYIKTKVEWSE